MFFCTSVKLSNHILKSFSTRFKINRPCFLRYNEFYTYSCVTSKFRDEESRSHDLIDIKNILSEGLFKPIYYFPYIIHARVICRLKLYQTGCTLALLPIYGIAGSDSFLYVIGISTLATFMLYVMGEFFCKFIGAIYLSEDSETLIISHLSFFGNRKNFYVSVMDIIPFSDTSEIPTDIYVKIRQYSKPGAKLYMCLKYGGITESKLFSDVFGKF